MRAFSRPFLSLALACGDKSDDTGGSAAADTDTDTDTDAAFHAWGTYDGEAFDVACHFDDTDPEWSAGIQCQEEGIVDTRPLVGTSAR